VKQTSLKPWHDAAVRQWLGDCNLPSDQAQRERIAWATGNWGYLLTHFHNACVQDPLRITQHLQRLHESLGNRAFATEVARRMGLDLSAPCAVLRVLAALGRASFDDLVELIDDISPSEVRRSLRWADLLTFMSRGEAGSWTIDRIVARILSSLGT